MAKKPNTFLIVLEVWKSFWFAGSNLLTVSLHGGERTLVSSSSYKGTNSIMGTRLMTSSKPNLCPKATPPNTIPLKNRSLTYEFIGEHKCIQSIAISINLQYGFTITS